MGDGPRASHPEDAWARECERSDALPARYQPYRPASLDPHYRYRRRIIPMKIILKKGNCKDAPKAYARIRTVENMPVNNAYRPGDILGKTGFSIKSDSYQGPFELLLDLIETRKLLVNDLALASITEDFIRHVQNQETFTIEETAN